MIKLGKWGLDSFVSSSGPGACHFAHDSETSGTMKCWEWLIRRALLYVIRRVHRLHGLFSNPIKGVEIFFFA